MPQWGIKEAEVAVRFAHPDLGVLEWKYEVLLVTQDLGPPARCPFTFFLCVFVFLLGRVPY